MANVRILITGVAGQDGTILAAKAERSGARVVGVVKPGSDTSLLARYAPEAEVLEVDLADHQGMKAVIRDFAPDQLYNLGGWSSVGDSWDNVEQVRCINVEVVAAMLDEVGKLQSTRFFQASSAAIFEGADAIPQTELSWRAPQTPYAQSKSDAMDLVNATRDKGVFAVSGILYNHESPLRGENFVTRRITMGVARIAMGLQDTLELGDIEVARDWGWAPDYVDAMLLMLSSDIPRDYVLATGISHRLTFFLDRAFRAAGIERWEERVVTSTNRKRRADSNRLVGESRAAYRELGWRHTVDFDTMAEIMVKHDLALLSDPEALWPIT